MNNKINELIIRIDEFDYTIKEEKHNIIQTIHGILNENPYEFLNECLFLFCTCFMINPIYKHSCFHVSRIDNNGKLLNCNGVCCNFKLAIGEYRCIPIFDSLFEKYNKKIILNHGIII